MNKVTIISGDGHATPLIPDVIPYFEPILRPHVDDLIREDVLYVGTRATPARPPRLTVPPFDDRGLVRAGGEYGASHPKIRLEQMDAEGLAAELVLPGTQVATLPFFSASNAPWSPEIRAAGARAYHRWLADFMSESDGRLFGVAESGPCLDMDETIAELKWCADNGFVSVSPPGVVADADLPPLYDPYFDPFWAACEEFGLVLTAHAGWNMPQVPTSTWGASIHAKGDGETTGGHDFVELHKMMQVRNSPVRMFLQQPRRPMWMLMAAGVFDRFPGLKLALSEIRADWVPDTITHLDATFADMDLPCQRSPREYYTDNCLIIPSSPHKSEAEMRGDIGIEQFGFGQDFPHWESTWPNTLPWLQHAFGDATENELRSIVGGNVANFFNLPIENLDKVAAKIGPEVSDILGEHDISADLLNHFDRRAGYLRSADPVFADELDAFLEPDLAGAAAAVAARV